MGLLDAITGGSGPVENPVLDKTKKALEGLRSQVEGKQADQVLATLEPGFKKDLDELGITDETERTGYWEQVKQLVNAEMAKATPEFQALNGFVDNPQSLTALNAVIEGKKPAYEIAKQLETVAKSYPKLSWLPGFAPLILVFMRYQKAKNDAKNDGKELGTLDGLMAAFGIGGDKDAKKDPAELAKEKEKKFADGLKKKFSDKGLTLDGASIASGVTELAALDIKDEGTKKDLTTLVDSSLADDSNLMKIKSVIADKETADTKFQYKLTDIRLQKYFSPEQVKILVAAISGGKIDGADSKYALKDKSISGVRPFLDAALTMKKDGPTFEDAIKEFLVPAKVS